MWENGVEKPAPINKLFFPLSLSLTHDDSTISPNTSHSLSSDPSTHQRFSTKSLYLFCDFSKKRREKEKEREREREREREKMLHLNLKQKRSSVKLEQSGVSGSFGSSSSAKRRSRSRAKGWVFLSLSLALWTRVNQTYTTNQQGHKTQSDGNDYGGTRGS